MTKPKKPKKPQYPKRITVRALDIKRLRDQATMGTGIYNGTAEPQREAVASALGLLLRGTVCEDEQ